MTGAECEYELEIGQATDRFPEESCDRPTWKEYDRCIWHAPEDGKTIEMLEDADPETGENLDGAYLRDASLMGADWFAGASLVGADLTNADVKSADFSGANLTLATLTNLDGIAANFSGANLEGATFTNADLRQATLEDTRLYGTVLTNTHVGSGTTIEGSVYERDETRPDILDEEPLKAAVWVHRQLQEVYRNNALPDRVRENYFEEKDARRRHAWARGRYADAFKWELSRWVMRYGGSPYRLLLTSLAVIVVAAVLYPLTGGIQEVQNQQAITYTLENPEQAPRWWLVKVMLTSLYFSVVTFTTLGYGDIQPVGPWARFLATTEALVGSLLAALLVFVLARIVTW